MPGLSQLKQFNADILAIGDEARVRAARGERPIPVPIPRGIPDKDDSEFFVLGIPDIEEENSPAEQKPAADEDFSDITGIGKSAPAAAAPASSDAPDLSALLDPIAPPSGTEENIPDLSMFDTPAEEEEFEEEPEPEEVAIADLGLNALLASTGFEMEDTEADDGEFEDDGFSAVEEIDDAPAAPAAKTEPDIMSFVQQDSGAAGAPILDFLFDGPKDDAPPQGGAAPAESLDEPDPLAEVGRAFDEPETLDAAPAQAQPLDFDMPDLQEAFPAREETLPAQEPEQEREMRQMQDLLRPGQPEPKGGALPGGDEFSYSGSAIDMTEDLPGEMSERDKIIPQVEDLAELAAGASDFDILDDLSDVDDFELASGKDVRLEEDKDTELTAEELPRDSLAGGGAGDLDFDIGDINIGDAAPVAAGADDDFGLGDIDVDAALADLGAGGSAADAGAEETPAAGFAPAGETVSDGASDAAPGGAPAEAAFDDGGFGTAGLGDAADGGSFGDLSFDMDAPESQPLEKFDTSDIEGLDFSIPVTDAQLSGSAGNDDLGEFEIPGFSDIDTAAAVKAPKPAAPSAAPKSEEEEAEEKNALTDSQYKKFLKNISKYPLNVRIAVEDLLVKNEFTDDAEFEVVKKVLNKVPARSLASHLEKMLDISIPVPRDFEHRTAEEYEALKSSFQYQLKNRIVPAVIVAVVSAGILFGLFQFGYRAIYKPVKANNYYRQGYALIQSDDYPQSEILFEKAVAYGMQKKWFYRYAQAYREHKQYDRAEKMYLNILNVFRHDKQAGLEYADMEKSDRANYEKAEHILRRQVLDYHVNDADALLALGDVFLEWATERDAEKFDDARVQYASLIELYGQTDLYLSRMMRYFVRTDNLREVLQLKRHFVGDVTAKRKKSKSGLSGQDWTEMSGYLLDKLFGPLSPAEEYLRSEIEDMREMLVRAIENDPDNPIARYNMARYYIQMNNSVYAKAALEQTIEAFEKATSLKARDVYKQIDAYRLLGEEYANEKEYLLARETYTDGIMIYQDARNSSGLAGNAQVGMLYSDMGDMDYFISGNSGNAYRNYVEAVNLGNDTSEIRYKIGYIQYYRQDYDASLNSFLRAADENPGDDNLLLALGNTLALRGNSYAAEGYYSRLMGQLEAERAQREVLLPQVRPDDAEFVELMMHASNNYGVTLFNLATRTGSSAKNAEAMVQLSLSMRAWDALTRNQETLIRIGGSNLAEQNMGYMSRQLSQFEPAIYTDLPRTLSSDAGLGG